MNMYLCHFRLSLWLNLATFILLIQHSAQSSPPALGGMLWMATPSAMWSMLIHLRAPTCALCRKLRPVSFFSCIQSCKFSKPRQYLAQSTQLVIQASPAIPLPHTRSTVSSDSRTVQHSLTQQRQTTLTPHCLQVTWHYLLKGAEPMSGLWCSWYDVTPTPCDERSLLGRPTATFFVRPIFVHRPSGSFQPPCHISFRHQRHHNCTHGPLYECSCHHSIVLTQADTLISR